MIYLLPIVPTNLSQFFIGSKFQVMLPQSYLQSYQIFLDALLNLMAEAKQAELDLVSIQIKGKKVQQLFHEKIVPLTGDNLDAETSSRWQSLQTEIYRSHRLLNTDFIFLASARQPSTLKQRQASLVNNLEKILGYCQTITKI